MSTLLINANQPEEIRVALLTQDADKRQKLWNLYIENTLKTVSLKNVYAGIVRSIEPSLEAAFIEYGIGRHGFLPFKEIASSYCKGGDRQYIKAALKVGQQIMVQIKKEERGTKGAALTTYITLPGSYLVLMPNNPGGGGISRRIEGLERKEMQQTLNQLEVPEGMGLILRTAGVGCELKALQTDLTLLLRQWESIKQAFQNKSAPFLIFQEGDITVRAIRDYLREDIDEIIVDDADAFEKTKNYTTQIRPDLLPKLRLHQAVEPLFLHFGIEEEVESAFQRILRLPSGGTVIFDRSEALVAIDINSGGSTQYGAIEETALKTNLEAAEVIARQLRLRDLSGLIVIDFIDMADDSHKRQVETCLRDATRHDRARIQIGRISYFGLLEMSRQRLRSSLGKVNEDICSYCQGQGIRRSIESLALSAIRAIEKQIIRKNIRRIHVELSVDLATYLGNEKRTVISQLEQRHSLSILLLPNPYWENTRYKILALDEGELSTDIVKQASYTLLSDKPEEVVRGESTSAFTAEVPAVKGFIHTETVGGNVVSRKQGLLRRFFAKLGSWLQAKKQPRGASKKRSFDANSRRGTKRPKRRTSVTNHRNRRSSGNHFNQRRAMATDVLVSGSIPPSTEAIVPQMDLMTAKTDKRAKHRRVESFEAVNMNRANSNSVYNVSQSTESSTSRVKTLETQSLPKESVPVSVVPSSVVTERSTPSGNNTALRAARSNVRRFGGEPRLRGRSYNTQSNESVSTQPSKSS